MKTDWKLLSNEVSAALAVKPNPPQPIQSKTPVVIIRRSANRTERAYLALGRLA